MTNFPRPLPLEEQQALDAVAHRVVPLHRQLLNLGLILAAIIVPFVVTGKTPVLIMIGCLAFFIMFHEFAHFVVAKASGMKVTEFFIGFGPKLFSFRKGETEYGIKAIPAGGYVKIIGMSSTEQVADGDELRTYRRQRWYKRVATIVAGPASHFVMAFLLLIVIFGFSGRPELSSEIGIAEPGFPAATAGLKTGDRLVAIQGVPAENWNDVLASLDSIKTPVVELDVVGADGTTRSLSVTRKGEVNNGVNRWVLGIRPAPEVYITESLPTATRMASSTLVDYSGQTFSGVVRFFSPFHVGQLRQAGRVCPQQHCRDHASRTRESADVNHWYDPSWGSGGALGSHAFARDFGDHQPGARHVQLAADAAARWWSYRRGNVRVGCRQVPQDPPLRQHGPPHPDRGGLLRPADDVGAGRNVLRHRPPNLLAHLLGEAQHRVGGRGVLSYLS